MGVEVVHDQRDALCLGVARGDGFDEQRPVALGPALGQFGVKRLLDQQLGQLLEQAVLADEVFRLPRLESR